MEGRNMLYQPILLDTKGMEILTKDEVFVGITKTYFDIDLEKISLFEVRSETKSIGVEALKSFSSWLWNKNDELKLLLVFQAEKLTVEAQNSLLKIIEEPPKDTLIVLVSKNTDTLITTINSRCLNISLDSKVIGNKVRPEFLNGNYIDRVKLIDSIVKDDNSREKALKLVEELINYYLGDKDNMSKSDKLLEIYLGIKTGTNLKLSFSLVNSIVST
ncbi:MAG: hypothetical protein ACMG57_04090 [Candidatus Dojkabacteria bacterium]